MAEASSSAAGQADALPRLDAPAAMGIGGQSNSAEADDDNEWEYEYSTTETDVSIRKSPSELGMANLCRPTT
jgi:hypothetical protein